MLLHVYYSTPAPGHFNDDDTVDFMIHLNYGKWPEYFYSLVRRREEECPIFLLFTTTVFEI